MLTIKKRQERLKALGYYDGEIDGIAGEKTRAAYRKLQEAYFTRSADIDGIYGANTDKLLQNAYNVKTYTNSFNLREFRCDCGGKYCTGYPAALSVQLLKNLQAVRDKYGVTAISSGLRCEKHNAAVGGASGSRHKSGKAVDIVIYKCYTEARRREVMDFWRTLPQQRYTYCNIGGSYPNMGSAVHVDVK